MESMNSNLAIPSWEACKENVLPIKRGRSAKGLSDTLQKNINYSSDNTNENKNQEKYYEDLILNAKKASTSSTIFSKELLDSYIFYFKWIRDTYPSNSDKALKLLEVSNLYA